MKYICAFVFLLAAANTGVSVATELTTGDPLMAIARCFDAGEPHATAKERRTVSVPWREVATAAGPVRVSVADGYRLMLGFKGPEPFVNLKIESSVAGRFADDRAAVLAQMELFSAKRNPVAKPLEIKFQDGVEIMALNNTSIEARGPISFYSFAHERTGVIATAYFLSQSPATREFQSYAEYEVLRDRFINTLVNCLAKQ